MSGALTRAAMRRVVEGLAKLPGKAWLSVRTWEALVRGAVKPGGRLSRVGPSARVVPRAEVMDVEVVDFVDCARRGVVVVPGAVEGEGRRYWVLPPRVVYDGAGVGRLVRLGAGVVWREGRLESGEDEVVGVVAFWTPGGLWADETPPVWRVLPAADPDRDYPVSEVAAERVVLSFGVEAVRRFGPVFYARL